MRFRKVIVASAGLLTLASVSAAATAGASTTVVRPAPHHVVHAPRVVHAHWLRSTHPQVIKAGIVHSTTLGTGSNVSSGLFFTNDGAINKDLPKNSLGSGASLATAPVANPTSFPGGGGGGASSALGVNAYDQEKAHVPFAYDLEPPDQGLCAGNGYVLEPVNMVMRAFHSNNLTSASFDIALESFFGVPYAFGLQGGDVTVGGDVRCLYDQSSHRWFVTQILLDESTLTSAFMVAVSTSSNPFSSYNVYSLDNTDLSDPGCPCLGDQPLLGANKDALFISTNEFSYLHPNFNGTVFYALDKSALAAGAASVNVWSDAIGLNVPAPGGGPWYSIQPATSPTVSGGTEFALSALDFVNAGDNRIAAWAFTNTQSISHTPSIGVSYTIVSSEPYSIPPFARQEAGPIPLGDCVTATGCNLYGGPTTVTEGPIQTNDDRMNQVVYADGKLWAGVNTAVNVNNTLQAGIAWFVVAPKVWGGGNVSAWMVNQGYVAPKGADVLFPSIGVNASGEGVMVFTLTGPSNFPSAAYETIDAWHAGPVRIAVAGQSPQDGFSEYAGNPRWGDYSAAVADGAKIFFATEMIQHPNCSDSAFLADPTCGGTRGGYANWGTSISSLNP